MGQRVTVGAPSSGGGVFPGKFSAVNPPGNGTAGRGNARSWIHSAAGVPNITLVHGSSTAGGAYIPGMSDYAIMVKDRAKVFLAGPPLVRAATGEEADDDEEVHSGHDDRKQ